MKSYSLDGNRDTVATAVGTVLGGVDNARSEQETDGDAELVAGHDSATDLAGGNLGHVQDDDGGDCLSALVRTIAYCSTLSPQGSEGLKTYRNRHQSQQPNDQPR